MEELKFMIPCLMGLEKIVADELKRLNMREVRASNGHVTCVGGMADIPRLNLWLRCGARVLLVLAEFDARTFEELFQGVKAIDWEDWIAQDGEFPVKGYSISSQLHSVPACQSIVKKAVSQHLSEQYGMEWLPETGCRTQIQFSILKDHVTVALDTSGEGLYKRGYRAVGVEAPLRETLAAALVILSRYKGLDPFRDPFCGSGTIAIEAALIAKNRAPGLNRSFAAQKWAVIPADYWMDAVEEAMDRSSTAPMTSGAATSTPTRWRSPGPTPSRQRWRTWYVLMWPTPWTSAPRVSMGGSSPTRPMANACWKSRRPARSTASSVRSYAGCPPTGG